MWKPAWIDPTAFQGGDIIGCSRVLKWWDLRHFFAWRIQQDTNSPYNHVGMLEWYSGRWHVIEATWGGGLVRTPLRRYCVPGWRLAVAEHTADRMHRIAALGWLKRRLGAPYDKAKIFKLRIAQLIWGLEVVNRMVFGENDKALICSEAVIRGIKATGPALPGVGDYAGPGAVMASVTAYRWWDGKAWSDLPWG